MYTVFRLVYLGLATVNIETKINSNPMLKCVGHNMYSLCLGGTCSFCCIVSYVIYVYPASSVKWQTLDAPGKRVVVRSTVTAPSKHCSVGGVNHEVAIAISPAEATASKVRKQLIGLASWLMCLNTYIHGKGTDKWIQAQTMIRHQSKPNYLFTKYICVRL